jgi:pilus assembly protein FimV
VARERALNEANERIVHLEKTIKDMQTLMELKSPGMAAAQQQAQQVAAPQPEMKPAARPEGAATPDESKTDAAMAPAGKPATGQPESEKIAQVSAPAPKPKAQVKPKPIAQRKEPELMDEVLAAAANPLYLGVGGGVLVLGLAFLMARRRRRHDDLADEPLVAPRLGKADAAGAGAAAVVADSAGAPEPAVAQSAAGEDVDPLAEAEVYIAYGRDGQAEEILKEALAKNPKREDVQLKLLEIYSARKDKTLFAALAGNLHRQTGGTGDTWIKAAAMGYALDPGNNLYEAGKDAVAAVTSTGAATDIDLDLGGAGTSTDITLDAGAAETAADTGMLDLGQAEVQAAAPPDFTLEVPPAEGTQTQVTLEKAPPPEDTSMLDFHIELPKAGEEPNTIATPSAATFAESADTGLDFKLDDLNLSLDSPKGETAAAAEKDGHWYDVQTKFDLAKAYQEMGDKDGAKEILQEVIKEGDAEQKAQAKTLMDSLG